MINIGIKVAPSRVANSFLEGKEFCTGDRFSAVIRPPSRWRTGGGLVHDKSELDEALQRACRHRPIHEVLVEKAVWDGKNLNSKLLRDKNDNVVIICTVEIWTRWAFTQATL